MVRTGIKNIQSQNLKKGIRMDSKGEEKTRMTKKRAGIHKKISTRGLEEKF